MFIDETGILMAPLVRRTWAPRGQTPVLLQRGRSYSKISMIGSLCAKPGRPSSVRAFFRIYPGKNITAPTCREFVRSLLKTIRGPIFIVWDRLNVHRSRIIKNLIKTHRHRLHLFYFPAYAPELNPMEYGWNHLKNVQLAQFAPLNTETLARGAKKGICSTRRKKHLLLSFIRHSGLPFFDKDK